MPSTNIAIAEAYYDGFNRKDLAQIGSRLHPEVHFVSPMGESDGKEAVLTAAKRLLGILHRVEFRARFAAGNQAMVAYDMTYGQPVQTARAAVLMDFEDGLIRRLELFYDSRPFGAV